MKWLVSATEKRCALCGLPPDVAQVGERYAAWMFGRGWLVDICGGEPNIATRFVDASWWGSADELRELLDANNLGAEGVVVTL